MDEVRGVPEFVRKAMYQVQGDKWYLPAAARLMWFRSDEVAADWGIETYLMEGGHEAEFCTVQATIRDDKGRIMAQAMKTETKAGFKDGWVEKAETGAISRALMFCGFGTQDAIHELDEQDSVSDSPVQRQNAREASQSPRTAAQPSNTGQRQPTATQAHAAGYTQADGTSPGPNAPSRAPSGVGLWGGPGMCPKCNAPEGKRHGAKCLTR